MDYTEGEYYAPDDTSTYGDADDYQPTRYEVLSKVAAALRLDRNDVFVDLGCGKGRVLCYMAKYRPKKIVGVELRSEMAEIARQNYLDTRSATPVEIHCCDAATFYSLEGTVYFLFNPFGVRTLKRVAENIRYSLDLKPRKIRIVYHNPLYGWYLDGLDWLDKGGAVGDTGARIWISAFDTAARREHASAAGFREVVR